MKQGNTQQEILFFTGTTFAQTELKSTDPSVDEAAPLTDQLENAFWNGLLFEILPELKDENAGQAKLFLWQVVYHRSFMSLRMGNSPGKTDPRFSLDPYLFSRKQFIN